MLTDVLQFEPLHLVLPLLAAVLAGSLIGAEREWRGRSAGFRTHILVCVGSALLMLAASSQSMWSYGSLQDGAISTDPLRIAQGVLSGIGFLCAGVIFRSGLSVHGLTTAASLWITSGIGLVLGGGLYALGAAGVIITLTALGLLRLIARILPAQTRVDVSVSWKRDGESAADAIEEILRRFDPKALCSGYETSEEGERVQRRYRLRLRGDDAGDVARAIADHKAITHFRVEPREL